MSDTETIVIGEWYAALSEKEQNERYYELHDECISKIGAYPGGRTPFVLIKRDGVVFKRNNNWRGEHYVFAHRLENTPQHRLGDVICTKCGSMSFHLLYVAEYQLDAKCIVCGTQEEVYSG